MREGESYGITNCGQDAFNIMRLEHGFKLWGREVRFDGFILHLFNLFSSKIFCGLNFTI